MSTTKSATRELSVPEARRPWEAPTLSKLALGAGTRARPEGHDAGRGEGPVPCPQPPMPAEAKPGLSVEWSFPMAYREK
jgi:hypothetical protein